MSWLQDLLVAVRLSAKRPAFTLILVLILALGIGANTAIFSFVDAVLLQPLPYPEASRLVTVWENHEAIGGPVNEWTSRAIFYTWHQQQRVFSHLAAWLGWAPNLTGQGGEPEQLSGLMVSHQYFSVLGITPAQGRAFLPGEDQEPEGEPVVVLSHGLWQRRFGGDPQLLGKTLLLNDVPHTVIGILPADFQPPGDSAEIWRPLAVGPGVNDRGNAYIRVIGRLASGVTLTQAQGEMDRIAAAIAADFPDRYRQIGAHVVSLHETVVGPSRLPLLALLGAVALILLIACSNVANFLLAQATTRKQEIAVRASLGAGKRQIVRQLFIESVLLALIAGGMGLLLGSWGLEALRAMAPAGAPRLAEVELNARVFAFTLGLSLFTSLLFGLLPALQATPRELSPALLSSARGTAGSQRSSRRLRSALVAAQVALALALVAGSGLLLKSFFQLIRVDPGFAPEGVATASLRLPEKRYPEPSQLTHFYDQVLTRLASQPGVSTAGAVSVLPLSGNDTDRTFTFEEGPRPERGREPVAWTRQVSPDYFQALGIRLVAGRSFTAQDREGALLVVIINQTLADHYFPQGNPLGKRLKLGPADSDRPWFTIIGVVNQVKHKSLDQRDLAEMYFALAQQPRRAMTLVARTAGDPSGLLPLLRGVVREVDPNLPVANLQTMDEWLAQSVAGPRFTAQLLIAFATTALGLAGLGLYGVLAYSVTRRTREIGVRMALGADPRDVVRLVIRQGLGLVVLGMLIGGILSLGLNQALVSLLFGVTPTDPTIFALTVLLLLLLGGIASYLPARRAAAVDPVVSLRYE